MIHDWHVRNDNANYNEIGEFYANPSSKSRIGCSDTFSGAVSVGGKIITIKNCWYSFNHLLHKLVASPSRRIMSMKIAVVTVLFPIIIIPLVIMAVIRTVVECVCFPFQQRFLYFRQSHMTLPPGNNRVSVRSDDNGLLVGYDCFDDSNAPCKGVVVCFPGNARTAETHTLTTAKAWQAQGFRCVFVSYPGYGCSEGHIRSQEDLYKTGQMFIDYAKNLSQINSCPLILMGESIGTGVAMHLAVKNADFVDKVILHAPYFSLYSLVGSFITRIVAFLIRPAIYNIPTYKNIIRFTQVSPDKKVLIMHAVKDEIIPYSQSRKIIDHYLKSKPVNPQQVALLKFIPSPNTGCPPLVCEDNHQHGQYWHSYLPDEAYSFILDSKWAWNNDHPDPR